MYQLEVNTPNGLISTKIAIKYIQIISFQGLQKLTNVEIFGLKMFHLATLQI
jgi:hypothetical protein